MTLINKIEIPDKTWTNLEQNYKFSKFLLGRKLTCECQILNDEKEIRRMTLQNIFGADFGGPGRRDFDLI